ncbi:hypothetical protein, partial [Mumia sp.]|uniref:hypothetical protein n=1 Tax=Mumia sp. TaxID=1965300 RepID=UPI0026038E0B
DARASWDTRPVILCEIGWGTVHPPWDKELEAFDMLTSLGYRTVGVDGSPVDVRELTKTTDVLFLPDHVPASSADPLSRAALR